MHSRYLRGICLHDLPKKFDQKLKLVLYGILVYMVNTQGI